MFADDLSFMVTTPWPARAEGQSEACPVRRSSPLGAWRWP